MHLLASLLTPKPREPRVPHGVRLVGPRVMLREAETGDWRSWRGMRDLSRDFLKPWEPEWPENSLSSSFFDGMLRRQDRDWRRGKAYAFLVFMIQGNGDNPRLAGGISLNEVRRGIAQKGTLGYWIGMPYAGQGLMTEAASLVCEFAFDALKLNRVEASCMPNNEPSRRLLKRLGFAEEGYAKSYLRIDGKWQDHVLWGKTVG